MSKAINKVVYGNETLIDLTADTITAADLSYGKTAHDKSGASITGTNTFDADTSDADASATEILATKTAYVNGVKVTGTMPNNGGTGIDVTTLSETSIPRGYSDGSAKVKVSSTEAAKIIPGNIREGVEILGVTGTMSGSEDVKAQAKTATPSTAQQVILPDTGYTHLTQVTVYAIPRTDTENAQGGITVTIG